jgi:glucose-1-phosphate cytidylyltransferase
VTSTHPFGGPSMKAVILAGGLGTRLSEETHAIPKPMVLVGGRPIIWHIMDIFSRQGVREFVVACGYRSDVIKMWFANYNTSISDIEVSTSTGEIRYLSSGAPDWSVTLIDTGLTTMTAGRVGRLRDQLGERFFLTYGDGLANVDIQALLSSHQESGARLTITGVSPVARFGRLDIQGGRVVGFSEKPADEGGYINGGFMVVEPEVLGLIHRDDQVLETDVLPEVASQGHLGCYIHSGFWRPMDTLRDKVELDRLAQDDPPPWLEGLVTARDFPQREERNP